MLLIWKENDLFFQVSACRTTQVSSCDRRFDPTDERDPDSCEGHLHSSEKSWHRQTVRLLHLESVVKCGSLSILCRVFRLFRQLPTVPKGVEIGGANVNGC